MKRSVSILRTILSVVLCAVLAACGGTTGSGGNSGGGNGGGGNPPPTVTIQQGQWEFSVNNGGYYVDANLTDSSGEVSSTVYNTAVFDPSQSTAFTPPGVTCGNVEMNGAISGNTLTETLESGGTPLMNFSGTLNSAGQSVSSGTSSATSQACLVINSGASGGTITGYTVPSFSGTYVGQITTWPGGTSPLSLTLTLTQNSDFSIGGSGQITGQGIVQTIVFPGTPTGSSVYSGVIGATFAVEGTLTDAAETLAIQVTGHANSNDAQIAVNILSGPAPLNLNNPSDSWQTGTLIKQ